MINRRFLCRLQVALTLTVGSSVVGEVWVQHCGHCNCSRQPPAARRVEAFGRESQVGPCRHTRSRPAPDPHSCPTPVSRAWQRPTFWSPRKPERPQQSTRSSAGHRELLAAKAVRGEATSFPPFRFPLAIPHDRYLRYLTNPQHAFSKRHHQLLFIPHSTPPPRPFSLFSFFRHFPTLAVSNCRPARRRETSLLSTSSAPLTDRPPRFSVADTDTRTCICTYYFSSAPTTGQDGP